VGAYRIIDNSSSLRLQPRLGDVEGVDEDGGHNGRAGRREGALGEAHVSLGRGRGRRRRRGPRARGLVHGRGDGAGAGAEP